MSEPRPPAVSVPRWPPPGLERVQGDLYALAGRAALAGLFLALPLLLVTTGEPGFASLGPLADAWWIVLVSGSVGLGFALDAVARFARTLQRSGKALERGYDAATILRVLADATHDMGFLLAGARHFSELDLRERTALAQLRVAAGIALATAGLWAGVGISIGLFLGSRGVLSPSGLQLLTLGPTALAYVVGMVAYLLQERRVRAARRAWHRRPWAEDLVADEIRSWREASSSEESVSPAFASAGGAGPLRWSGILVGVIALIVALPLLTLLPASAIGPILTQVSTPGFERYRPRAARAEAFRSFATIADPSVDPQEAGELLHMIAYAGPDATPSPMLRAPTRTTGEPWIAADSANPFGLDPFLWGDSLLARVGPDLTAEQRSFLADVADHPFAEQFARLARAPELDAASARWETPFAPGITMATLPVPRFGTLRSAANARIGAAADALARGRPDDAERILAEVIAVGFLLADQGPTLIDNLVGYAIAEAGGSALVDLFRVSDRPAAAAELSRLRQVADRAAEMMRVETPRGAEAWLRSLPGVITDSTVVRGLRWEYFINLATVSPCLNMSRMIFGPGEAYAAFLEDARASLVRWPSEEALFELARYGWVGAAEPVAPGLLGRIAGFYMSRGENSCARMLQHVSSGYQP